MASAPPNAALGLLALVAYEKDGRGTGAGTRCERRRYTDSTTETPEAGASWLPPSHQIVKIHY
jgi:hypothetical protein